MASQPLKLFLSVATVTAFAEAQYIVEVLEAPKLGFRETKLRCEATGANFGADVMTFTFTHLSTGCALPTVPTDSCGPVTMPRLNDTTCMNNFAIVPRGNCSFSEKAYHVQSSRPHAFTAIVIYNDEGRAPVDMAGGKWADKVRIPVVMVTHDCMVGLLERYPASEGYVVQVKLSPGYYDLFRYLIPFIVVIGFCFIVLLTSLLIRICRERRRMARKRLSKKLLRKIPTRRFTRGDQPDACCICLDDFEEGEKLRVLPCRHMYHCKCIDPWLTKNRKTCPMCKQRVGARNSDSESSGDERRRRQNEERARSREEVAGMVRSLFTSPYRPLEEDAASSSSAPPPDAGPEQPSSSSSGLVLVEVHQQSAADRAAGDDDDETRDDVTLEEGERRAPAGAMRRLQDFITRRFVGGHEETDNEQSTIELETDEEEIGLDNAAYEETQSRRSTEGAEPSTAEESRTPPAE